MTTTHAALAYRWTTRLCLFAPCFLLFAWMLQRIPSSVQDAAQSRSWTLLQRLISEPRILVDYLSSLLDPGRRFRGLFTDGVTASRDLLHPWTTLPSLALVLGLFLLAMHLRRRHPAWTVAILFFLSGHAMESTWLPLELYYEHRNYLPSILLFWPIGLTLCRLPAALWIRISTMVTIVLLVAALTWQQARLWGNPEALAKAWASANPNSLRAQSNAAEYDIASGHPQAAIQRLWPVVTRFPDDLQAPVNLIGAECERGTADPTTIRMLERSLRLAQSGSELMYGWFGTLIEMAKRGSCQGVDFAAVDGLLAAARSNPHWNDLPGKRQDLAHLQGLVLLERGHGLAALDAFNNALAEQPEPAVALEQAALLGSRGYPALGLVHLDSLESLPSAAKPPWGMPRIHAWVLQRQHYWPQEIAALRAKLNGDLHGGTVPSLSPIRTTR